MTPEQVSLVQTTFAKVEPIADTAATMFYDKLFELDPSLRPLFSDDLREQRAKLMAMLATAVRGLDHWDTIAPRVRLLGQKHADYGAKPGDYDTVGKALIDTLQTGLGDAFTSPVKDAWVACYTALSREMIQGAQS